MLLLLQRIVKGEKQYSVLWLADEKDEALVNEPSSPFTLSHFNCMGPGKKSVIRVTTAPRPSCESETLGMEKCVSAEDLERARFYVDDKKFYEKKYKLWRYNFDGDVDEVMPSEAWTPYYRLNEKQRRIVDRKYAPLIDVVVWSRWPGAVVDNISIDNSVDPII